MKKKESVVELDMDDLSWIFSEDVHGSDITKKSEIREMIEGFFKVHNVPEEDKTNPEIRTLDYDTKDPLLLLLIYTSGATLLPEIYCLYGKEVLIRCLERFEGKTIKFPTIEEFEELKKRWEMEQTKKKK